MQYRKIDNIVNVCGFEPQTGNYSFVNKDKEYLSLNNELFQKEEAPLLLMTRGKYLYLWYSWGGKLEVYLDGKLLTSIEKDTYLIDGGTLYVGYSSDFEEQNLINPITGELLLKNSIPYELYVMNDIIIAYNNFRGEFKRINTKTETLWRFTIASLGDSPYLDEEDKIGDILGITNNYLWIITNLGRLIAIDIEKGIVQKVASPHPIDEKYNYHINKAFGHIYIKERNGNLYCMSYNMVTIIDTQTFSIKEEYNFREEDPEGMGQYESIYKPLLQGDYFTFLGEKEEDYGGIRRIGIFDYKARKLVWEYEVISEEECDTTRNQLVISQPLYMSGNKLYIKDIKNNLHIFEREDI